MANGGNGDHAGIIADFKLALKRKGLMGLLQSMLTHAGNQAIALYRINRWLWLHDFRFLAMLGYRLNFFLCNVELHPEADIEPGLHLDHPVAVIIHRNTHVGKGCRIMSHTTIGGMQPPEMETEPLLDIRDYVQVHHNAVVMCTNHVIGEFSIIGAGAIVLNMDVPPYATVVGNPARIVRIRGEKVDPEDYKDYRYDPADYTGPPWDVSVWEDF